MKTQFLLADRPTVTVMVQARTPKRAVELIGRGLDGGADAFGVQLEQLEREYHTPQVLTELFRAAGGKPIYVTNYRTGMNEGRTDADLTSELLLAADCGATLIDIMGDLYCPNAKQLTDDLEAVDKQMELIGRLHQKGTEVLVSSHTFCFETAERVMAMVAEQHSRGADICKVVTAAGTPTELAENFCASTELARLEYPSLFLCVGEYCGRHRRIAPLLSNSLFLCVTEHDELATPAQPLLKDARRLADTVFIGKDV